MAGYLLALVKADREAEGDRARRKELLDAPPKQRQKVRGEIRFTFLPTIELVLYTLREKRERQRRQHGT